MWCCWYTDDQLSKISAKPRALFRTLFCMQKIGRKPVGVQLRLDRRPRRRVQRHRGLRQRWRVWEWRRADQLRKWGEGEGWDEMGEMSKFRGKQWRMSNVMKAIPDICLGYLLALGSYITALCLPASSVAAVVKKNGSLKMLASILFVASLLLAFCDSQYHNHILPSGKYCQQLITYSWTMVDAEFCTFNA